MSDETAEPANHSFEVVCEGTGVTVTVPADKSILDALFDAGSMSRVPASRVFAERARRASFPAKPIIATASCPTGSVPPIRP